MLLLLLLLLLIRLMMIATAAADQSGCIAKSRESKGRTSDGSADMSATLLIPTLLLLLLLLLLLMTGEARGVRQGERVSGVLQRLLEGLRIPFCSMASAAAEPTVGLNWLGVMFNMQEK